MLSSDRNKILMDIKKLDTAIDSIDINPDISKLAWKQFCDWLDPFYSLDISVLQQYKTFFDFNKVKEAVPLELEEQINDLWSKWSKARELDNAN